MSPLQTNAVFPLPYSTYHEITELKSRQQFFKASSLRSDAAEAAVVLAEVGGSQAGGETASLRKIPGDRLYIIDCLSVYSLSSSS